MNTYSGYWVACSAICCSFVDTVCDLNVSSIVPPNRTLCPVSPSLQWVPWALVPHLTGPRQLDVPSVLCSTKIAMGPSQVASLSLASRYLLDSLIRSQPGGSVPTAPGSLFHQLTVPSGNLTRRPMALPRSRATPLNACPARGPQWCRTRIAIARMRLLPSRLLDAVGFHPYPGLSTDHNNLRFRGSVTRPALSLHPASNPSLLRRTRVHY